MENQNKPSESLDLHKLLSEVELETEKKIQVKKDEDLEKVKEESITKDDFKSFIKTYTQEIEDKHNKELETFKTEISSLKDTLTQRKSPITPQNNPTVTKEDYDIYNDPEATSQQKFEAFKSYLRSRK